MRGERWLAFSARGPGGLDVRVVAIWVGNATVEVGNILVYPRTGSMMTPSLNLTMFLQFCVRKSTRFLFCVSRVSLVTYSSI